MSFRNINPLWNLQDIFTVTQAAALIAGVDPQSVDQSGNFFRDTETGLTYSDGIRDVQVALESLVNAINARSLSAILRYDAQPRYEAGIDNLYERSYWGREDVGEIEDVDGKGYVITSVPNWDKSTVGRKHLIGWLSKSNIRPIFFFPDAASDTTDYLDSNHPRYAPKLAAAVYAWQAVGDEINIKSSPKQALEKWLRENAVQYGLADNEGKHIEKAIEECSKVANWSQKGGAPKTLG